MTASKATSAPGRPPGRRAGVRGLHALIGCALVLAATRAPAAESMDAGGIRTTGITLKLDAPQAVETHTNVQDAPPSLLITFPTQQVVASLPERSSVPSDAIEEIRARYRAGGSPQTPRVLESLEIVLSGPYPHRVRSEPGRVVVEIDHPASVGSDAVEVGLRGGTIVSGLRGGLVSERFRAMQEALEQAAPGQRPAPADQPTPAPSEPTATPDSAQAAREAAGPPAPTGRPAPSPHAIPVGGAEPIPARAPVGWPMGLALGLTVALAMGATWRFARQGVPRDRRRAWRPAAGARLPSGVALVDQLVWQAFERQGYQLVKTVDEMRLPGLLRIVTKDGAQAGLLFVWNGLYFEKRVVDQFAEAMRTLQLPTGFLIAPGSFTVPAQGAAKQQGIALIARDELVELISTGATREHFTRQLEQAHQRLDELRESLRRAANEYETIRRQRNEASWHLGEERAKASKVQAELDGLTQQSQQQERDVLRWEQEVVSLRTQWEQNQWHLGESRARVRYLERQVSALQERTKQLEPAGRERDEAVWRLAQAVGERQALEGKLTDVERGMAEALARAKTLEQARNRIKEELDAIQTYGERRRATRAHIPKTDVELLDGDRTAGPAVGSARDLSASGLGVELDCQLRPGRIVRIRMRLPSLPKPIESRARLIWQVAAGQPGRYRGGYRMLDLSGRARAELVRVIKEARSQSAGP